MRQSRLEYAVGGAGAELESEGLRLPVPGGRKRRQCLFTARRGQTSTKMTGQVNRPLDLLEGGAGVDGVVNMVLDAPLTSHGRRYAEGKQRFMRLEGDRQWTVIPSLPRIVALRPAVETAEPTYTEISLEPTRRPVTLPKRTLEAP